MFYCMLNIPEAETHKALLPFASSPRHYSGGTDELCCAEGLLICLCKCDSGVREGEFCLSLPAPTLCWLSACSGIWGLISIKFIKTYFSCFKYPKCGALEVIVFLEPRLSGM